MVAGNNQISGLDNSTEQRDILRLSHGTAVILLFSEFDPAVATIPLVPCIDAFYPQVYLSYLVFQLVSHKSLYEDECSQKPATVKYAPRPRPNAKEKKKKFFWLLPMKGATESGSHFAAAEDSQPVTDEERQVTGGEQIAGGENKVTDEEKPSSSEPDEEDDLVIAELSLPVTLILIVVITASVAVTAEWLVDSIDGLSSGGVISKGFIGLILLPSVSNSAEHVTEHFNAVRKSLEDKLTLSLDIAFGGSIVSSLCLLSNCAKSSV